MRETVLKYVDIQNTNLPIDYLIFIKRLEQPENAQRRIKYSDQYPFYLKGVPFIRIDCGFAKDYHQPTDTPDKINYDLLKKQAQLAFCALWNIANY